MAELIISLDPDLPWTRQAEKERERESKLVAEVKEKKREI